MYPSVKKLVMQSGLFIVWINRILLSFHQIAYNFLNGQFGQLYPAVQFKNDALKMRFDWGKLRNTIKLKKRPSQHIRETLKQLFLRKINLFPNFLKWVKK